MPKLQKKIVKENNYQNLDPIDIELMELEKEIAKKLRAHIVL